MRSTRCCQSFTRSPGPGAESGGPTRASSPSMAAMRSSRAAASAAAVPLITRASGSTRSSCCSSVADSRLIEARSAAFACPVPNGRNTSSPATVAGLLVFRPFGTGQANAADLASIKRESATLEQQLERVDPDARVMSGTAAALAAALEDRIAAIDGELARVGPPDSAPGPGDLVKLWQQRVDLMQQLVGVHVTRAVYVGL